MSRSRHTPTNPVGQRNVPGTQHAVRVVGGRGGDPFGDPEGSSANTSQEVIAEFFSESQPTSVAGFSANRSLPGIETLHSVPLGGHASSPPSRDQLLAMRRSIMSLDSGVSHSTSPSLLRNFDAQNRGSFTPPPAFPKRTTPYGNDEVNVRVSVKRARSTMLTGPLEKPWIGEKDTYSRVSYWVTWVVAFLGIAGGAVRCYFGWKEVPRVGNLCLVMQDDFNTFDLENTWTREVQMGGFGNGEFEMTTDSSNNSFVQDGRLYIAPTLTSNVIGHDNVMNGYTYNITGCTSANSTACGVRSNLTTGTVINPAMSARITTRNSHSIKYGKVEIVAKLPQGDWLWPALWMLPVNDTYGPWPASGEIDIMESRGNGVDYSAQGVNYVRSSLNWGPLSFLNGVAKTYGWWTNRRSTFADGFHTYAVEWTPTFIRMYVDTRLHHMFELSFNEPFFARGDFPETVLNGSQYIAMPDPWVNGTRNVAPFDQPFYLIMNVAVGGTNGWFPDGVGGKPWLDASDTAMHDFSQAQATWSATWPQNVEDRAMVVDSVKMWQSC
ncbi:glycoside hydrolase family 16 protein [Postia placenta MAD-698-R-SB12]|uniref:Glycoside hydrolase family 16 protein n=1 Tax=Postia placenta MAD-698-R-SB12 TaxID=670580 RepID=A0A1X6N3K5_9APHY|nr:glycoside hydrolase family 16 protein [Postia placenta MAD-698-R-SB12]OSX63056.1 glycoside hydrolase family 16 protein [Postia placenta MAD-698-R-SB12]